MCMCATVYIHVCMSVLSPSLTLLRFACVCVCVDNKNRRKNGVFCVANAHTYSCVRVYSSCELNAA